MSKTTKTQTASAANSHWVDPMIQDEARSRTFLANLCREIDLVGKGTETARVPRKTLSGGDPSGKAEADDIATTQWSLTHVDITPGEYGVRHDLTDRATGANIFGEQTLDMAAESAAGDIAVAIDDDVASLFGNASQEAGVTDAALELSHMAAAVAKLNAGQMSQARGSVFVISPQQEQDLYAEALAAEGTLAGTFLKLGGSPNDQIGADGYVGKFMGRDIWVSDLVDEIGVNDDSAGALFIKGENPKSAAYARSVVRDLRHERDRNIEGRATKIVVTTIQGVAENADESAVLLRSRGAVA